MICGLIVPQVSRVIRGKVMKLKLRLWSLAFLLCIVCFAPLQAQNAPPDAWYGPVTIRMENGKLVFTLDHTPKAIGDLQHWQYDTFKAHWRDRTIEDAFLTFTLRPDGAIDHFTMVAVSPLADFSFDYQDLYFTPAKADEEGKK